jgi:hypothetical protein
MSVRLRTPDLAAGILALAFAWVCANFVLQPGLATFADDSVSYLVMAQVFSPWHAASPAVAEAFVREAFYPPLFPAILAIADASHDIARAHVLTALLLAACLPLTYALGRRWLPGPRGPWSALAAVAVLASLPSLWVHAKGILSEPLFALLMLGACLALETKNEARRRWILAGLLAALALTRTVGLLVAVGYALWALACAGPGLRRRAIAALPAAAAVAAYVLWILVRPKGTSDDYVRIVIERADAIVSSGSPLAAFGASLLRQGRSMAEAWAGAFLVYWVRGDPTRLVLAWVIGAFAAGGLVRRFVLCKADAWMAAAYLATFLLWPFFDQMTRFLFPLLPLLVLYAFWAAGTLAQRLRQPGAAAHGLVALFALSLTAPALVFLHQRAKIDGPARDIIDWYRVPGLDDARRRAQVQLDLMADMEAIRSITGPQDRVMWVAPSYLALLADRRGVPAPAPGLAPEAYRRAVAESGASYVYLSRYHPRDTLSDAAWRAGGAALFGYAELVRRRVSGEDATVSSVLLRVPRP